MSERDFREAVATIQENDDLLKRMFQQGEMSERDFVATIQENEDLLKFLKAKEVEGAELS